MNKTFDRYGSIIFAIIGVFFIVESTKISTSAYGSQVGPNIFPMGLGILLVLLSLRLFYETLRYTEAPKKETGTYQTYQTKRFVLILLCTILYAILLESLGYVISTFLFLLACFNLIEKGKWWPPVIVAAAFSGGVYFVYVDLLQGTLPGFPTWLGF
ncbi:tripartite tricarboxylate transporter TctB family protein [Brevibacillus daliensis]|uniref:tripartite tricarboxylate transporter TctB family protein n=1 Tax=Brevibacillus daliensis TaxID=2892995 RepID=UPI001E58848F|nr:tripartite tricarboxylate transporter TctB family protein [Brevibacillus daliensis]